jgi:hypothetical protein
LHNPSTQKKALNGLKRSVGDAQHPSGLISFLTFWGVGFAWAQCYVHMDFPSSHKKIGNTYLSKTKKKRLPNNLFPIKQKKEKNPKP